MIRKLWDVCLILPYAGLLVKLVTFRTRSPKFDDSDQKGEVREIRPNIMELEPKLLTLPIAKNGGKGKLKTGTTHRFCGLVTTGL